MDERAHFLGGLRVLELGEGVAAPFAARLFADLGAQVIKVERREGDGLRRMTAADGAVRTMGALFPYVNSGKRSVALDLDDPESRVTIRALLEWADAAVVDETFASLLSDDLARAVASGPLVVTCLTPFGLVGPYAGYAGTAASTFAAAGETSMLPGGRAFECFPNAPPLVARGMVADYDAGVIGALVTAAGLYALIDGKAHDGITFDVSRQDCEFSLNRWLVSQFSEFAWVESRETRAYAYAGLTRCADGFVMLQPSTAGHWAALKAMMGDPEWARDPTLDTADGRGKAGALVNEHLAAWASGRTKQELLELGLRHGCPVGPFFTVAEVAALQPFHERGFFVSYHDPAANMQTDTWPHLPFHFVNETLPPVTAAPRLGEHTAEVLAELASRAPWPASPDVVRKAAQR